MAKPGSSDVFLLIDGYDLTGDTFELEMVKEALTELTHGFGDAWEESLPTNIKSGGVTQRSFYDDETDGTSDALVGSEGTSRVLLAGVEGKTPGKKAVGFS